MYSTYKNRITAVMELRHRGYKIGKSKFYKDCSHGLCRVESDGTITDQSLGEYIQNPLANMKRLDQLEEDKKFKLQRVNRLVKTQEAARILNCDEEIVIGLCEEGFLRALHVGTSLRILSSSIQRYVNRQLAKFSYNQTDSPYIIACLKKEYGLRTHEITPEMIHLKRQLIRTNSRLKRLRR